MTDHDVKVLSSGHGLLEPVRCAPGVVWFSDWTNAKILRYDLASAVAETVATVASMPLCFDLDQHQLVVLDAAEQQLLRGTIGGRLVSWVDLRTLAHGAGNEVLVGDGRVWLNFGNFDPRSGFPTAPVGLIGVVEPDGDCRVVADSVAFPNAMALVPARRVTRVGEGGTVHDVRPARPRRLLLRLRPFSEHAPRRGRAAARRTPDLRPHPPVGRAAPRCGRRLTSHGRGLDDGRGFSVTNPEWCAGPTRAVRRSAV